MVRALLTGGTGLLGRALVAKLPGAVVLSRDPRRAAPMGSARVVGWNPESEAAPQAPLREVDVVFNLAGEPVAGRWTDEKKRRIRDSRVKATRNLVLGLQEVSPRPSVLVSASAVGFYGERGNEVLDEASPRGGGFLAEVCDEWEREARKAEPLGIRVVTVRIGIVLSASGGALARMLMPFKFGVGGRLGSGTQWMSWIHLEDVVGMLLHAGLQSEVRGAMNAVAPGPVTNAEFTRALGHAARRPALLPLPAALLRIGLGEMSELLLGSQRVVPRAAERTGYVFKHPEVGGALAAALGAAPSAGRSPRRGAEGSAG